MLRDIGMRPKGDDGLVNIIEALERLDKEVRLGTSGECMDE